ncbi:MAG: hypothetical protein QM758_03325 [Armatimonas sp.]
MKNRNSIVAFVLGVVATVTAVAAIPAQAQNSKIDLDSVPETFKKAPDWKRKSFAFLIPVSINRTSYSYNAETGIATVYGGDYTWMSHPKAKDLPGVLVETVFGKSSYYDGEKEFGIKQSIEKYSADAHKLIIKNMADLHELKIVRLKENILAFLDKKEKTPEFGLMDLESPVFGVSFAMDKRAAKSVLPELQVVFSVTLSGKESVITDKSERELPTAEHPVDINHKFMGLIVKVDKVMVRNRMDKKVWKTLVVIPSGPRKVSKGNKAQ